MKEAASAYHHRHQCGRGAEPDPTLWWRRNVDKPYHIDYTFVSRPESIETVTVGAPADWLAYSDHSPMTVDLHFVPHTEMPADTVAIRTSTRSSMTPRWLHDRQPDSSEHPEPGLSASISNPAASPT